jgi:CubicO group peptidase (beta-lactamase class C family)
MGFLQNLLQIALWVGLGFALLLLLPFLFSLPGRIQGLFVKDPVPNDPSPLPTQTAMDGVRDLAELLEPIRRRFKLPALAGALVMDDRLVSLGAVGVRRVGHPERVTPHDHFHLGSCTKAMTATLCALLVEENRLRWNSTIAEVFPDIAAQLHANYRTVTLEQLLQHRSGLSEGTTFNTTIWPEIWKLEGPLSDQRRQVLKLVFKDAPAAAPGLSYQYSNCGYTIAGAMCEAVTGRAWEDLMRERIFAPLGMATAGFGPPGTTDQIDQPWGHHLGFWTRRWKTFPPREKESDNPAAIGPAGNVHCSLADWARFALCHLRGERGESGLSLPSSKDGVSLGPGAFRLLHSPTLGGNYAFGWLVEERDWGGGKVLTHAGSNTMWTSLIWLAPQRNLAILAATNLATGAAFAACDTVVGRLIEFAERGS